MKYGLVCLLSLCLSMNALALQGVAETNKKDDMAAENEHKKLLQGLEATRSGKIAFSGKVGDEDITLQWGDSVEVCRYIHELHHSGINLLEGPKGYYIYETGDLQLENKTIELCVDRDVGLFQIRIVFCPKRFGGVVTIEDLKAKYINKHGKPEELYDSSGALVGYHWVSSEETVKLEELSESGCFMPSLTLRNPTINEDRKEAVQQRLADAERERDANVGAALDF